MIAWQSLLQYASNLTLRVDTGYNTEYGLLYLLLAPDALDHSFDQTGEA